MATNREYSAVANWTGAFVLICGGTYVIALIVMAFGQSLILEFIGNPLGALLPDRVVKVVYGLIFLMSLHLLTKKWWTSECISEYENTLAVHEAATKP